MLIDTGISIIMNRWLEITQDELVLFITDEHHLREAEAVEKWARSSDSVVRVIVLDSQEVQKGQVIEDMSELLSRSNVIIGATDYSFITTPPVIRATKAGARFLSLPLSCTDGTSLLENEFIAMDTRWASKVGKKLQSALKKASSVRVTTKKGTDLLFDKRGRTCGLYNGMATRPRQIASTSFEVFVPIVEHGTEGKLSGLGFFPCAFHMVEDPADLGTGEIRIDDQTGLLPEQIDDPGIGILQFFRKFRGAAALPDDRAAHGFP